MAGRSRVGKIIKAIAIILSIPVGILALCTAVFSLFFLSMMPLHDLTLWRMENGVKYFVEHPSGSYPIVEKSFFGTRYTDTSECTYAAGEIRATDRNPDQVLNWYRDRSINFFGFGRSSVRAVIIDNHPVVDMDDPADEWAYNFIEAVGTSTPGRTYYIVYLFEPARSWFGDYRCFD